MQRACSPKVAWCGSHHTSALLASSHLLRLPHGLMLTLRRLVSPAHLEVPTKMCLRRPEIQTFHTRQHHFDGWLGIGASWSVANCCCVGRALLLLALCYSHLQKRIHLPFHAWYYYYTSSRSRTGFFFTVLFSHWKIMFLTQFGNVEGLEKIGGLHCWKSQLFHKYTRHFICNVVPVCTWEHKPLSQSCAWLIASIVRSHACLEAEARVRTGALRKSPGPGKRTQSWQSACTTMSGLHQARVIEQIFQLSMMDEKKTARYFFLFANYL